MKNLGEITVLEDIDETTFEAKLPEIAKSYLKTLRETLENSFKRAQSNRNAKMDVEKIAHDRKIKKAKYQVGDYVLCDHPRIKKGMSRGIAHKYYGPFEIKKVDDNGIDYVIQRVNAKKAKKYKIHPHRLKLYHRKHVDQGEEELESNGQEENNITETDSQVEPSNGQVVLQGKQMVKKEVIKRTSITQDGRRKSDYTSAMKQVTQQ